MPGFKDEDLKKFSLIINKSIKTFLIKLYWAFFLIFLHFFQIYLIPWTVRWLRYLDTDIYHNILTNSHLNKFSFNPRCVGGQNTWTQLYGQITAERDLQQMCMGTTFCKMNYILLSCDIACCLTIVFFGAIFYFIMVYSAI